MPKYQQLIDNLKAIRAEILAEDNPYDLNQSEKEDAFKVFNTVIKLTQNIDTLKKCEDTYIPSDPGDKGDEVLKKYVPIHFHQTRAQAILALDREKKKLGVNPEIKSDINPDLRRKFKKGLILKLLKVLEGVRSKKIENCVEDILINATAEALVVAFNNIKDYQKKLDQQYQQNDQVADKKSLDHKSEKPLNLMKLFIQKMAPNNREAEGGICLDARTREAIDFGGTLEESPRFTDFISRAAVSELQVKERMSYFHVYARILNECFGLPFRQDIVNEHEPNAEICEKDGIFDTSHFTSKKIHQFLTEHLSLDPMEPEMTLWDAKKNPGQSHDPRPFDSFILAYKSVAPDLRDQFCHFVSTQHADFLNNFEKYKMAQIPLTDKELFLDMATRLNKPTWIQVCLAQPTLHLRATDYDYHFKQVVFLPKYELTLWSLNEVKLKNIIKFECNKHGIEYRMIGISDDEEKIGQIYWYQLPKNFPRVNEIIFNYRNNLFPILLEIILPIQIRLHIKSHNIVLWKNANCVTAFWKASKTYIQETRLELPANHDLLMRFQNPDPEKDPVFIGTIISWFNCTPKAKTLLELAAAKKNWYLFSNIIKMGYDLYHQHKNGMIAIQIAAENHGWECVKEIASSRKADKEDKTRYGSALLIAAQHQQWELVDFLINSGAAVKWINTETGYFPVHFAILDNKISYVRRLLENNWDINIRWNKVPNPTLLHVAAEKKDVAPQTLRWLLEQKDIKPNLPNEKGETALFLAIQNNDVEKVKILLEHPDVNIEVKRNDGKTPLAIAKEKNHVQIVDLLLEKLLAQTITSSRFGEAISFLFEMYANNADNFKKYFIELLQTKKILSFPVALIAQLLANIYQYNPEDFVNCFAKLSLTLETIPETSILKNLRSELFSLIAIPAIRNGHNEILQHLLGENLFHATLQNGNTLLHYAAQFNQSDIVVGLLNLGLDASTRNNDGRTALDMAATYESWEAFRKILAAQPKKLMLEAQYYAAREKNWDLFFELHAKQKQDEQSKTVLHYAVERNDPTTTQDILEKLYPTDKPITLSNELRKFIVLNTKVNLPALNWVLDKPEFFKQKLFECLQRYIGANEKETTYLQASALHSAILENNIDFIVILLSFCSKDDVLYLERAGKTSLQLAADNNRWDIFIVLIRAGYDPCRKHSNTKTAIQIAADSQAWECVHEVIKVRGNDVNNEAHFSCALLAAVENKQWLMVNRLLNAKAGKKTKMVATGYYALHYVVLYNQISYVQKFLSDGCSVNIQSSQTPNPTPLHIAAGSNEVSPEMLQCLLDQEDSNLDVYNEKRETPLFLAVLSGNPKKVSMLLEHPKANYHHKMHMKCKDGRSILTVMAQFDQIQIINVFLEKNKYSLYVSENDVNIVMDVAARYQSWRVFSAVLTSNDALFSDGLYLTAREGNWKLFDELFEKPCNDPLGILRIALRNDDSNTILSLIQRVGSRAAFFTDPTLKEKIIAYASCLRSVSPEIFVWLSEQKPYHEHEITFLKCAIESDDRCKINLLLDNPKMQDRLPEIERLGIRPKYQHIDEITKTIRLGALLVRLIKNKISEREDTSLLGDRKSVIEFLNKMRNHYPPQEVARVEFVTRQFQIANQTGFQGPINPSSFFPQALEAKQQKLPTVAIESRNFVVLQTKLEWYKQALQLASLSTENNREKLKAEMDAQVSLHKTLLEGCVSTTSNVYHKNT